MLCITSLVACLVSEIWSFEDFYFGTHLVERQAYLKLTTEVDH